MSSKKVSIRTRFAPSPTGYLHLGGIRSALFNYLFAKHSNGKFILRIEDTDQTRLVGGALDQITKSIKDLGIQWDEGPGKNGDFGPYIQSERKHIYQKYAQELLENGHLYRDWTSSEQLESLRKQAQMDKQPFKFRKSMADTGGDKSQPHVLRFQIPNEGSEVIWDDAVKGQISYNASDLDEFVAIKSDGLPTYHFACVVDDHLMQISHVIRADEWIASTPKHILLYEAFGWEKPHFAHIPPILGPDGKKKLSKRDGVKSVTEYIDEGYLPETLINFLALLGWHPGEGETREIYSLDELIKEFSLERIQKSPAKFDPVRLEWMNGVYIRHLPIDELAKRVEDFWPKAAKQADAKYKKRVLGLVQERLKYFGELPELTEFFFTDPEFGKEQVRALKKLSKDAESILNEVTVWLSDTEFTEIKLEEKLRKLAENGDYHTGKMFGLIRISITGKTSAPGLFETLATLGKESSLKRIQAAIDALLTHSN